MTQLRSGKVVAAREARLADPEVAGSWGAGGEPGKQLVVKRSLRLALKRKSEQPLPSGLQPAMVRSSSLGQVALLVSVPEEQGGNSQKFPGKKAEWLQRKRAARNRKGVAPPVSDAAECEGWQAAARAAAECWEGTGRRGTGQSQQLFFSGAALQNKFSADIERKEHCSEDPNLAVFQEGSRSSGTDGKYSCMEIKLQIPSSEEEIESSATHGFSCFPEPEGLQPGKVAWCTETKCTGSIMMQNMQIPGLGKNLGPQEAMSETNLQEEVDTPEKLDGSLLVGSRKQGTQEKEERCLSKKGGISLVKPKLCSPRKEDSSALLEVHAQCPESRKAAGSMRKRGRNALLLQQLQGLNGQEQPTTRGKTYKHCMKEKQQSSSPQKDADSPEESAQEQLKVVEQDSSTSRAVKKVKTKRNRSEDFKEKESCCRFPVDAASGGTQSKSFLSRAVTKNSDVQYKKRRPSTDQIKHLESFSVTAAGKVLNTSAKCDAEHSRNGLNPCSSGLLCATKMNPFVRLEDCSYINTLMRLSASGTTSSYKLNGFSHVAHGAVEASDTVCSLGRMQNERSPIKGSLSSNKDKNGNGEGCFSCCLGESNKCSRGKKWNIGRKPLKITEKSAVQNTFTDKANECSKCELQTEVGVAVSGSFAVSGLNHTLSDSCDDTLNLHTGRSTHEAQNVSAWKTKNTKLPAFENGFKKTSEVSVIAKGENSGSVTHSAASSALRMLAQVHDASDCCESKIGEKLNSIPKELQQSTCQRTVPMTGKKVWPVESCARTSEWSISDRKNLLKAAFEDSSDKSSIKAVGDSAVTGSLKQLDLDMSLAEMTKASTHEKIDPNTECQTSLETPESCFVDFYKTLRSDSVFSLLTVNTDRSAVAFNLDDEQQVKATLNLTAKQKEKTEGFVTNRNMSVTVRNGTIKQKDKNGNVTNRNVSVTVQNGTVKQEDKNGDETNRNVSVTVQKGTSTGNAKNFSPKVLVENETFSDLKLTKAPNPEDLTKFKIPLCRNKPESRKLESDHLFEKNPCSPLQLLESTSVSRRHKTGGETFLVNSKQQPLPVRSDATSAASMKKKAGGMGSEDFEHNGSENFSNEMSVLPGSFSAYPHPLLIGQLESSVPGACGTKSLPKPSFSGRSRNSVDHLVGLQTNDDSKSRGDISQHKSQNLPDILEAYKQDVLVIDVIQDDPDLFGSSNEEELALARCENCPVKVSSPNICTKQDIEPESPVTSEKTVESGSGCMQESGMSNESKNSCDLVLKAEDIKPHNSSRGSSSLGGVAEDLLKDGQPKELDELLKSFDVNGQFRLADGVPGVKQEKKSEVEKSDCKYKGLVNCDLLSRLPVNDPKVDTFNEATGMKSWKKGYKPSGKSLSLPLKNCRDFEPWKMEKNAIASHSVHQILDALDLPRKYCRYYFLTSRGCARAKCWFCHVPEPGDEKICMAILRTYINIKESGLLKRAVQIFVQYYRDAIPGVDFASQVLNDLLVSLLKNCLLHEVFRILDVTAQIKTLPDVDVILKVFEHVASFNIGDAVPTLISTFCKLIDAGMFLELDHFDYIIKLLHQLQVSSWEISIVLNIKTRFKERHFEKNWIFDFNLAVAEIQHCKEKRDWTKLAALCLSARTGCECFDDLQKLFLSVAEILIKDSETDRPEVPFCEFADAVMKKSQHSEADKLFIGRTGISVMYSYHKVLQWIKGGKVLDKLHELQINFTLLKGLTGAGGLASRCQIVNKAAEIFLNSGNLDGAIRVLRESEWTTNAPLWPCDKTDILNRHNLLCILVHKYLSKSLYKQAFEVLQNLPGLQKHSDIVDVSLYSCLFNKLINACFENKNLGVSSSAVDFMLSKKIAVDFFLLRRLITALGRSSLWSKARTYYKNALSLGCYPQLQGNSYHKLLKIPSYLSEVEMLLAMEIFLVSNATDIQSPMTTSQTLQIILKRCEDQTVQNNSAYQVAVERLILAARSSDPKLFLKHMTMTVNMEEVYSLELSSALKWLQENRKWAEEVWLFQ